MMITFPPDKADLILEAFCDAPEKMKGQGKALAQLYLMSSKNQVVHIGFNTSIGKLTPDEAQTAFITDFTQEYSSITDFTQEYSSPKEAAILFKPILSENFLTQGFLSAIYGRPDVFTKDFREQSLKTISPRVLSNFITLLQEDIKNLPHFNSFNKPRLEDPTPKIAKLRPVMELLFNVYCYTKENTNYHLFMDALPGYEEMIKKMYVPVFQDALIFCPLHKEIVRDKGNPCVEDISGISSYLNDGNKDMYTVLILFCLSKEYNDEGSLPLKIEMLKYIMSSEHFEEKQHKKVHEELYDFFEQGNDSTKEIIKRYSISKDTFSG